MNDTHTPSEFEVAIDHAHEPLWKSSTDIELNLLESLLAIGATIPDEDAAMNAIEDAFDRHGDRRAAETLAHILGRLPGGKHGAELRAALLGALECSGQQIADELGETRQGWHQRIARLRNRIFKNVDAASPNKRPSCR